jgi:hypothetical protein
MPYGHFTIGQTLCKILGLIFQRKYVERAKIQKKGKIQ